MPPAGAEFQRGDVTCRADLERALADVDAVVHLAAETGTGQSMYEIDRYYRVNVQGTALMFDIMANRTHGVTALALGSSRSVYGESARCTARNAASRPVPITSICKSTRLASPCGQGNING